VLLLFKHCTKEL